MTKIKIGFFKLKICNYVFNMHFKENKYGSNNKKDKV